MKNIILSCIIAALTWMSQDFYYLKDAIDYMNKLPADQRDRAYVIALNSARSGLVNGYYSVIYPKFD